MNLNRYFGLTVMAALLITLSACSSKTAETEGAAKEKATEQHAGEAKEEHGKEEAAGEHAEVGGESGEEEKQNRSAWTPKPWPQPVSVWPSWKNHC